MWPVDRPHPNREIVHLEEDILPSRPRNSCDEILEQCLQCPSPGLILPSQRSHHLQKSHRDVTFKCAACEESGDVSSHFISFSSVKSHVFSCVKTVVETAVFRTVLLPPGYPDCLVQWCCGLCPTDGRKVWLSERRAKEHVGKVHSNFYLKKNRWGQYGLSSCRICGKEMKNPDLLIHIRECHPPSQFADQEEEDRIEQYIPLAPLLNLTNDVKHESRSSSPEIICVKTVDGKGGDDTRIEKGEISNKSKKLSDPKRKEFRRTVRRRSSSCSSSESSSSAESDIERTERRRRKYRNKKIKLSSNKSPKEKEKTRTTTILDESCLIPLPCIPYDQVTSRGKPLFYSCNVCLARRHTFPGTRWLEHRLTSEHRDAYAKCYNRLGEVHFRDGSSSVDQTKLAELRCNECEGGKEFATWAQLGFHRLTDHLKVVPGDQVDPYCDVCCAPVSDGMRDHRRSDQHVQYQQDTIPCGVEGCQARVWRSKMRDHRENGHKNVSWKCNEENCSFVEYWDTSKDMEKDLELSKLKHWGKDHSSSVDARRRSHGENEQPSSVVQPRKRNDKSNSWEFPDSPRMYSRSPSPPRQTESVSQSDASRPTSHRNANEEPILIEDDSSPPRSYSPISRFEKKLSRSPPRKSTCNAYSRTPSPLGYTMSPSNRRNAKSPSLIRFSRWPSQRRHSRSPSPRRRTSSLASRKWITRSPPSIGTESSFRRTKSPSSRRSRNKSGTTKFKRTKSSTFKRTKSPTSKRSRSPSYRYSRSPTYRRYSRSPTYRRYSRSKSPLRRQSSRPFSRSSNRSRSSVSPTIISRAVLDKTPSRRSGSLDEEQSHQETLFCDICKIYCEDDHQLQQHLVGQKHKSNQSKVNTGSKPLKGQIYCETCKGFSKEQHYQCKICGVHSESKISHWDHIKGKKHKAKVKENKGVDNTSNTKDVDNTSDTKDMDNTSVGDNHSRNAAFPPLKHCPSCDETFEDQEDLKHHVINRHKLFISCKSCKVQNYDPFLALTCGELLLHLHEDHHKPEVGEHDLKYYGDVPHWGQGYIRCSLCIPSDSQILTLGAQGLWFRNYVDKQMLRTHVKDYHSPHLPNYLAVARLGCQVCSMEFVKEASWQEHLESHKQTSDPGKVNSKFDFCFQSVGAQQMESHIRSSHGKLAFKCKICPPEDRHPFVKFSDILSHLKFKHKSSLIHTRTEDIIFPAQVDSLAWVTCKREDCQFRAIGIKSENLENHSSTQHGVKGGLQEFNIFCRFCDEEESVYNYDDIKDFEGHLRKTHFEILERVNNSNSRSGKSIKIYI